MVKTLTITMEKDDPLFQNISRKEFSVTRYHSLDILQSTMPSCLQVLSRTSDDQSIMIFKQPGKIHLRFTVPPRIPLALSMA